MINFLMKRLGDITGESCCFDKINTINELNFQEQNNYCSYLTSNHRIQVNSEAIERNLFVPINEDGDYIEICRNNKLFGYPVSLKAYTANGETPDNKKVVFEHLDVDTDSGYNSNAGETTCGVKYRPVIDYGMEESGTVILEKSSIIQKPVADTTLNSSETCKAKSKGDTKEQIRTDLNSKEGLCPDKCKLLEDILEEARKATDRHEYSAIIMGRADKNSVGSLNQTSPKSDPIETKSNDASEIQTPSSKSVFHQTGQDPNTYLAFPPERTSLFSQESKVPQIDGLRLTTYGAYILGL